MQPDDILLDQSMNIRGERPLDIESIVNAPAAEPFRIQEVEKLEELIVSLQTSRLETREAVFLGLRRAALLNGPFPKALKSGQEVDPREKIQIFWPIDIINDYIKVKNKRNKVSWLIFKNSKSEPQVILLEDFVIPQVAISDSKLVIISHESDPVEPAVDVTSEEVVKEISYNDADNINTDADNNEIEQTPASPAPLEVDLNPQTEEVVSLDIMTPNNESEVSDLAENSEPSKLAPKESVRPVAEDEIIEESSERQQDSQLELEEEQQAEELSKFAPATSIRPTARPPQMNAAGMTSEQLLTELGIEPVKIVTNESSYISNGRKSIAEVFPNAHKTFSACTFDPAQGPGKSRCYRELVLSKEFTEFIGEEGLKCANDAAKLVFDSVPSKVIFRTNGGSLNRGSSRSLHDRGRALDVFKVFLYFQKGDDPKEIVFHKNSADGSSESERQNYNFYWEFEDCWTKKVQKHHKTKSCGSNGSGALTYRTNDAHKDHMHISLPVCRDVKSEFNLYGT